MTRPTQTRIFGLLALVMLGFHGGNALGHHHEAGLESDCVVCTVHPITTLGAAPDHLGERLHVATGEIVEAAAPAVRPATQAAPSSRGPPL